MTRVDEIKAQLGQLDDMLRNGTLTGDAARQARDKLEAEMLAAVLQPATPPATVSSAMADASAGPSGGLLLGLAAFVVVLAGAGYAWLGNPAALAVAPGATAAVVVGAAASAPPHEMGAAQFEAMAERLAERLKTTPDDAEGWSMLGRSYSVLGRFPQALEAYKKVRELQPQDAQALVDYADALGMVNNRSLDGEPAQLIVQALQIDPNNVKALSLAGTIAFDRGDAVAATGLWERALRGLDPASEMAQRLKNGITEARQRAKLPPLAEGPAAGPGGDGAMAAATPGAGAAPNTAAANDAASQAAAVQARITLAPALAAQAAPDDTLYIFARAVAGPKAPLAIQRRQVKDLPLDITLDDSMAMSPAMRLSTVTQVIVGARISKSGNPMPQPGDLQGLSAPVAVGSRGLQIQIGEAIR